MKSTKDIIKPLLILTISFLISTVLVGMIAYSNSPEAKLFIDNLFGTPMVADSIGQA